MSSTAVACYALCTYSHHTHIPQNWLVALLKCPIIVSCGTMKSRTRLCLCVSTYFAVRETLLDKTFPLSSQTNMFFKQRWKFHLGDRPVASVDTFLTIPGPDVTFQEFGLLRRYSPVSKSALNLGSITDNTSIYMAGILKYGVHRTTVRSVKLI